ncbi:transcriptional regulator [Lachnospiraceae bacterium JC7]|nr:transcriptional regulator [Lachnospiraceae bacterium JC7]
MEIKELNYLIAIAEEKSISKAAERLYMAQSSLSQFLSCYESNLGYRLFVRTSNGVRPTESGQLLLEYAYHTISEYHRVQDKMQDVSNLDAGHVILGISSFRGSYLLPPVLNAFHMTYPNIHVQIVEKNSMALEQYLMNGDIDLALLARPEKGSRLHVFDLLKDEICLVASPNHPVMSKAKENNSNPSSRIRKSVRIKDAAKYEFLLSDFDTILGREARRLFMKNRITPLAYNNTLSALFAASLAANGQGLAFTYYSSRHYFRNAEFLSLGKDAPSIDLVTAMSPDRYHSKAALALNDVIQQILNTETVM